MEENIMSLKKIIAAILCTSSLCASLAVPTSAETTHPYIDDDISLAYEIATTPTSILTISSKTASCKSSVHSKTKVEITVEHTLEKYSGLLWIWSDVDGASWTKTANSTSVTLTSTKSGLDSGTYRLRSEFTLVDSDGETETFTIYSDEKKVS